MRSARRRVHTETAAVVFCLLAVTLSGLAVAAVDTDGNQPPETGSSAAALPAEGVVHFGEELGGVSIGTSRAQLVASWGPTFGTCRSCTLDTLYFTYEDFAPEGVGVELVDERVKALYTLWQPLGWRSGGGLRLGTPRDEIPDVYLELSRVECAGYDAYVHERGETKTVLYMHEDTLWAFGLIALAHPVCR